jgi:hypothetical protein
MLEPDDDMGGSSDVYSRHKRQPARSADGADDIVNQARHECGLAGLAKPLSQQRAV